jgi:phosphatidylinositol glycan class B
MARKRRDKGKKRKSKASASSVSSSKTHSDAESKAAATTGNVVVSPSSVVDTQVDPQPAVNGKHVVALPQPPPTTTTAIDRSIFSYGEQTLLDSRIYYSPVLLYIVICIFRICNTFLIQSYFDPDEFWQTLEPAYCQVFFSDAVPSSGASGSIPQCPGHTWEWTRRVSSPGDAFTNGTINLWVQSLHGPVRSYASVVPTIWLYKIAKSWNFDTRWLVARGPMIMQAMTVAAPVDMAIWYTARWLRPRKGQPQSQPNLMILPAWCLFASLTSWFQAYVLVRTLANVQETAFLILAIALVSPELIGNVDAARAAWRSGLAFILGGIAVSIRFTAMAAFVPMGILLAIRQSGWKRQIQYLILPCAGMGLIGIAICMVVDHAYYGFWTIPFLGNFHFNAILKLSDLYGSNPLHWYVTVGLPTMTGLLLPFVFFDLSRFLRRKDVYFGQRNLWIITLSYLFTMSINSHKEFRFILPVMPLLCLLTAPHVRTVFVGRKRSSKRTRIRIIGTCWVLANLLVVLYLGLFHQSGPISVNREIVRQAREAAMVEDNKNQTGPFSIHYLTGACHSTPLHSHLHAPPLRFVTWHLDCSPACRSNDTVTCESDQFAQDPTVFMKLAYHGCHSHKWWERKQCTTETKSVPNFLVTFSEYVPLIQDQLNDLGLRETARFAHTMNGARIQGVRIGEHFGQAAFRRIQLLEGLEMSVREVVLFTKLKELPVGR